MARELPLSSLSETIKNLEDASRATVSTSLPTGPLHHLYAHDPRHASVLAAQRDRIAHLLAVTVPVTTRGRISSEPITQAARDDMEGKEPDALVAEALTPAIDHALDAARLDLHLHLHDHQRDRPTTTTTITAGGVRGGGENDPLPVCTDSFSSSPGVRFARGALVPGSSIPPETPSHPPPPRSRPQDAFLDQPDNTRAPFRLRPWYARLDPATLATYPHLLPPSEIAVETTSEWYLARVRNTCLDPAHVVAPVTSTNTQMEGGEMEIPHSTSGGSPPSPPPPPGAPLLVRESDLAAYARSLRDEVAIAVDLEHHDYRSFQGFTCLMQISSRRGDVLVDTMALRDVIGKHLGSIFADPRVVKVMHGARADVGWLQKDFGIFIVGLFDTGEAARVLGLPGCSLAFLLKHYVGLDDVDKQWQLADWRTRPLTTAMRLYAQQDTRYLLYIYDRLRHDLAGLADAGQGGLDEKKMLEYPLGLDVQAHVETGTWSRAAAIVVERSRRLAATLHVGVVWTPDAWRRVLAKEKQHDRLSPRQRGMFRALYDWRDAVGRDMDESAEYVLPRATMWMLALATPTDEEGVRTVLKGVGRDGRRPLRGNACALARAREIAGVLGGVGEDGDTATEAAAGGGGGSKSSNPGSRIEEEETSNVPPVPPPLPPSSSSPAAAAAVGVEVAAAAAAVDQEGGSSLLSRPGIGSSKMGAILGTRSVAETARPSFASSSMSPFALPFSLGPTKKLSTTAKILPEGMEILPHEDRGDGGRPTDGEQRDANHAEVRNFMADMRRNAAAMTDGSGGGGEDDMEMEAAAGDNPRSLDPPARKADGILRGEDYLPVPLRFSRGGSGRGRGRGGGGGGGGRWARAGLVRRRGAISVPRRGGRWGDGRQQEPPRARGGATRVWDGSDGRGDRRDGRDGETRSSARSRGRARAWGGSR